MASYSFFLLSLFILTTFFQIAHSSRRCTCPKNLEDVKDCREDPPPLDPSLTPSNTNSTTQQTSTTKKTSTAANTTRATGNTTLTSVTTSTAGHRNQSGNATWVCCIWNENPSCQNNQTKEIHPLCPMTGNYWDNNTDGKPECRLHCQGEFELDLHWYKYNIPQNENFTGTCKPEYGLYFYLIVVLPTVVPVLIIIIVVLICVVKKRKSEPVNVSEDHQLNTLPTKEDLEGVQRREKPDVDSKMQRKPSKPNSYVVGAQVPWGQSERVESIREEDEGYENEAIIEGIQQAHAHQLENQPEWAQHPDRIEPEPSDITGARSCEEEELYENTAINNRRPRPDSFEDNYGDEEFDVNMTPNHHVNIQPSPPNNNQYSSQASYTSMTDIQQALNTEEDVYIPPSDAGRSDDFPHSSADPDIMKKIERLDTILKLRNTTLPDDERREYDYAADTSPLYRPDKITSPISGSSDQLYTGEARAIYAEDEQEVLPRQPTPIDNGGDPIYQNYRFENEDEQVYENN